MAYYPYSKLYEQELWNDCEAYHKGLYYQYRCGFVSEPQFHLYSSHAIHRVIEQIRVLRWTG